MAIKRFSLFTKSAHDLPADSGTAESNDVSVIDRPLPFGQRAWATFTAITRFTPVNPPSDSSPVAGRSEVEHSNDARHLEIGGYFQSDHAWAGSTHETAPLENIFDHGAERIFDRFGPH